MPLVLDRGIVTLLERLIIQFLNFLAALFQNVSKKIYKADQQGVIKENKKKKQIIYTYAQRVAI